jgi:hypothetical protein
VNECGSGFLHFVAVTEVMARDGGKFPGGGHNLDAGFAIGESSGGGLCQETENRGELQLVAWQILAA